MVSRWVSRDGSGPEAMVCPLPSCHIRKDINIIMHFLSDWAGATTEPGTGFLKSHTLGQTPRSSVPILAFPLIFQCTLIFHCPCIIGSAHGENSTNCQWKQLKVEGSNSTFHYKQGPVYDVAACICLQWPTVGWMGGPPPRPVPLQTEQTRAGLVLLLSCCDKETDAGWACGLRSICLLCGGRTYMNAAHLSGTRKDRDTMWFVFVMENAILVLSPCSLKHFWSWECLYLCIRLFSFYVKVSQFVLLNLSREIRPLVKTGFAQPQDISISISSLII